VRPGQLAILVADNAASVPARDGTDVRTAGIDATQEIRQPLRSARVGLDAVAAVLPEPAAAYAGLETAEQVRLGLDLEWVTAGGVYPYKDLPRYEIPCEVTGTVSIDGTTTRVRASGERDHSWGERDWWQISWLWTSGRLGDGTAFHGMQANIGFAIGWPSFAVPPAGELSHVTGFCAHTDFGADDFPRRSLLRLPGAPLTVSPLAFAPVAMTSPDGRVAHFPRALCEFAADDGRTGYGWTEWNQPPGWRDHGWSYLADSQPADSEPASAELAGRSGDEK